MSPTTKRIHAMLTAVPARPVKPSTAATRATMRNRIAQENMALAPMEGANRPEIGAVPPLPTQPAYPAWLEAAILSL
jgi:hypothetical protein